MPPIPKRIRPAPPDPLKPSVTAGEAQTAPSPPNLAVTPLRAVTGPCRACNGTGRASNGGACYPCSLRGAVP